MKIFTNGASFAAGSFPQMIADHYNAELTNIASIGYSNRSIWRTTIEYQPKEYDLAILQFTSPSRHEYHDERKWIDVSAALAYKDTGQRRITPERKEIWKYWYENMYSDEYGDCEQNFAIEGLRDYFALNETKCIIVTTDKFTRSKKFDLNIFDLNFSLDNTRHPTEEGHKIISDAIIKYYETFISWV
jgi:hypothetical protein